MMRSKQLDTKSADRGSGGGEAGAAPGAGGEMPGNGSTATSVQMHRSTASGHRSRLLTIVAVIAVVLFALWGIGGPLVGTSVLGPTDEMVASNPYVEAGIQSDPVTNVMMDDIYTAELPNTILFKHTGAGWNPYESGGAALGSIPDGSFYSPLTLPFFVLPTWLAPAYERLLEIICAVAGCFLFLRRLRLSRPAALAGGLVFAGSGFMVVWLTFPHTRVAAFIPALFWMLERFIQRRRPLDAALIAVPVAAMLLGGFPSVAGYTLLTAAAYALVRVVAQYRNELARIVRLLLGAAAGVCLGVALAAFQLLPFLGFYRSYLIEGRGQSADQHLNIASLITMIAPFGLGTVDTTRPPAWYLPTNLVESMSYLGSAAIVLVLIAIAGARAGRALLPRATWLFLVVSMLAWAELIYVGRLPLAVLQQAPGLHALFGGNYIGRSRSILCFLLAALAAVGLDLLLRRKAARGGAGTPIRGGWRRWCWPAAVWLGAAGIAAAAFWSAHRLAGRADAARDSGLRVQFLNHQVAYGAVLVVAALVAAVVLARSADPAGSRHAVVRRTARVLAASALLLLIAGQGVSFVRSYYPHSPKDTFYPVTDTHEYLAANLGDQRYATSYQGMIFGSTNAYELRSLNGHAFINKEFAALIRGVGGNPIPYPTYLFFNANEAQASSPILDRLGTKYFLTAPQEHVFGDVVNEESDGGSVRLAPETPITVALPRTGRTRGVGFTPTGTVALPQPGSQSQTGSVEVVLRDAAGTEVASASRRVTTALHAGTPFVVPIAGDDIPAGTRLTATITLHATTAMTVAARAQALAVSQVTGADDGLRLVHTGGSVIYQRLNAQPRIRWAGHTIVQPDQQARVGALASGSVSPDTVVLSSPGAAAGGTTAKVDVLRDDPDVITVRVDAAGSGYLVVADADQTGWAATVDGQSAHLVPADQGIVAVPVAAGQHTVQLRFAAPHLRLGTAVTSAAGIVLIVVILADVWWFRRRGSQSGGDHLGATDVTPTPTPSTPEAVS